MPLLGSIGYIKKHLWVLFKNGADSGFLLELFNKTLHPILTSGRILPLYFEIENYISGVEK